MKLRSVNTSFWSDPFIEDLTPSEKLLYLYLITNEKTNMLGIYEVSIKKISFDTGINKEMVQKALEGFERLGKLKYIDNFIILTKYLKHQSFNTNMKKSAIDCYNSLPERLKFQGLTISKDNPLEGFERLLNHYGILSKVEVEVEVEEKKEVELEDENENEEGIVFPFDSNEFLKAWDIWKEYKNKEHKFKYKSALSEQAALKKISKLSHGNDQTAIAIIYQSIENGWSGFFKLKNNSNGNSKGESDIIKQLSKTEYWKHL